jgi:fructose-1,6-bisphosphatase/inositol monophosphatase family enzyme
MLSTVIDSRTAAQVEQLIRDVAAEHIRPYFGRLTAADIVEKGPGDLVTIADRTAEAALTQALTALVPGTVVVGEEAVAGDPGVLTRLAGPDPVWVIDPVDGTHNFAAGNPRFTTLVTLAQAGELLASWTYAPVLGVMATARRGEGAYVDGVRLRAAPAADGLRYLDVCVPQPHWWPDDQRAGLLALCGEPVRLSYLDTSGLEYIELAAGRRQAMVVTWEHSWDHVAGLLLHIEAGGIAVVADGGPFRLAGGNPLPLVLAPDADTAARLHAVFAGVAS